ncbi:2-amino-4-hydroxy-6-hydroxymethyldihydropteridine diphosphokinase [Chloroflexota bacterium]
MNSKQETVYLSLGSNMGNRQANLEKAIDLLLQRLRPGQISSVYETEPIGNPDQPRFLNLVCQVFTRLAPEELLMLAKGIELKMGRARGTFSAPRPIDIDILFYGDEVIETEELTIPHPRLNQRAFVLIPLVEIAPDLVHPVSGSMTRELLNGLEGTQGVLKLEAGQKGTKEG